MSDTIPLPPRFMPDRPTSAPEPKLTRTSLSPLSKSPMSTVRSSPYPSRHSVPLKSTTTKIDNDHDHELLRRSSLPTRDQMAHQLAAEALLTMAPSASNASPGKRASATPARGGDVEMGEPEQRGVKRKSDVDDAREREKERERERERDPRHPAMSLGLHGMDRDRNRSKEWPNSPLPLAERPHALPGSRLVQPPTHGSPAYPPGQPGAPNRYSVYGPTTRDPMAGSSPYSFNASRYSNLHVRRDMSPSIGAGGKGVSPPRRASPVPGSDPRDRFYGNTSTSGPITATATATSAAGAVPGAYGHYSMGRRELQEHREQLKEGKRWLEAMLAKTEKMLNMVENKIGLTVDLPPAPPAHGHPAQERHVSGSSVPPNVSPNAAPGQPRSQEDWEYEERERRREKEILRLEQEREMDMVDREKRERDRAAAAAIAAGVFDEHRGRSREAGEHEQNRDRLLASRRVSAISPGPAGPGRSPNLSMRNAGIARERESEGPAGEREKTNGPLPVNGVPKREGSSQWDGEPVLAGVPLPRREREQQQNGAGRTLGRGLWSFDVRS
ncbi:hypothetical protein L198_06964 [Cryptococcus wingfieldii CBS 7118]|uniref:Uncharacterized protein n=1 Tax=Cryptococcus wingfieldii CBS 7118 TaxID=1295528 RepID=A0A1E3IGK7_9TREE|nr:hypothetical protein L198_06964 [Cryptococcus wingfieldii CBS 7118]ODN87734.1 hypothetical protein L198_06964 [Cryptococcus wingfieldii CBS 7118]